MDRKLLKERLRTVPLTITEFGQIADMSQRRPSYDWTEKAACRQTVVGDNGHVLSKNEVSNLFYPEKHEPIAPAKKVCETCPVKLNCATVGIVNNEKFGVWGGLSRANRKRVRVLLKEIDIL